MPSVQLRQIQRCKEVDAHLSRIKGKMSVDEIYRQLELDGYLYGLFIGDVLAAVMIVHFVNDKSELWVTHAAGDFSRVDLTEILLVAIDQLAGQNKCKSIAFMTRRAGLIKKTKKHGFLMAETVMRKAV